MNESAEFELPTQEDFRCGLRALCLGAIRMTLESLLNEEIRNLVDGQGVSVASNHRGMSKGRLFVQRFEVVKPFDALQGRVAHRLLDPLDHRNR